MPRKPASRRRVQRQPALSPAARRVLEAHVAYLCDRSQGAALRDWLARSVDEALADAEDLRLEATVPRALVKSSALRFAAELPMTGGIADLIATVSRRLREHVDVSGMRLGGLLPEASMQEIADKLVEMRPLQRRLLRTVLGSQEMQAFLRELLLAALRRWADSARGSTLAQALSALPLAATAGQLAGAFVEQRLEAEWERLSRRGLRAFSQATQRWLRQLDDDSLHVAADHLVAALRDVRLDQLRAAVSDDDVDDFAALSYGLWQEMRRRPEYRALIEAGIDAVYDQLGEASLAEVLAELGITRRMILDELRRYAEPVLDHLRQAGVLEALLRRQLAPFYASEAFAEAIAPLPSGPAAAP